MWHFRRFTPSFQLILAWYLNYSMTVSFRIHSNSSFTNDPAIQRYTMQDTGFVAK